MRAGCGGCARGPSLVRRAGLPLNPASSHIAVCPGRVLCLLTHCGHYQGAMVGPGEAFLPVPQARRRWAHPHILAANPPSFPGVAERGQGSSRVFFWKAFLVTRDSCHASPFLRLAGWNAAHRCCVYLAGEGFSQCPPDGARGSPRACEVSRDWALGERWAVGAALLPGVVPQACCYRRAARLVAPGQW